MKLRKTVPKKICQIFTHINIACLCFIHIQYTQMNFVHSQFIYFWKCVNFSLNFLSPTEQKGNCLRASWLLCIQPYNFIFLYAYIYGNRSRIFINGSLFQVSKKLCLIVNLVFILLGPTASSIHRQEKEQNKAEKKMRYKCIHFFLILCTIDFERNRREAKERIWKIYII
jgi:hypothetical protein